MPFTPGRPLAEAKADLFRALAHPGRIQIIEALVEGEATVGQLASITGLELSHLSQQLTILRRTGLVASRRVASSVTCWLAIPQTNELLAVARLMILHTLADQQEQIAALMKSDDAAARSR